MIRMYPDIEAVHILHASNVCWTCWIHTSNWLGCTSMCWWSVMAVRLLDIELWYIYIYIIINLYIYIYVYTNTVSDKTREHDLWNGHANEKLSNGRLLVMIQLGSYQAHQGHMIIYSETTGLPEKPIMSWCLRVLRLRTSKSTVWNSCGCAWKWYLLRQASACWRGNYIMNN